jgi:hypothetical protein
MPPVFPLAERVNGDTVEIRMTEESKCGLIGRKMRGKLLVEE